MVFGIDQHSQELNASPEKGSRSSLAPQSIFSGCFKGLRLHGRRSRGR